MQNKHIFYNIQTQKWNPVQCTKCTNNFSTEFNAKHPVVFINLQTESLETIFKKKNFSIELNFSTEVIAKQAFDFINLHSQCFGDYTLKLDYRIQC